jgi:hypothetical protein
MRDILEPCAWNPVGRLETVRVFVVQHATFSFRKFSVNTCSLCQYACFTLQSTGSKGVQSQASRALYTTSAAIAGGNPACNAGAHVSAGAT